MDRNTYRKELSAVEFDPTFQQRVLRELNALAASRKEPTIMKHTKHITRYGLIAAILVLALAVTAFAAILHSSYEAARQDLNLDKIDPIPEYTEFPESAPQHNLSLVSALRSGSTTVIYLEASPIEFSYKDGSLESYNQAYDVEGYISLNSDSQWTTLVSYDEDTQTALFKMYVLHFEEPMQTANPVIARIDVLKDRTDITTYGPISVPLPEPNVISADLEIPFSTAVGSGTLLRAVVSALDVRIDYTFPAYTDWDGYISSAEEAGIDSWHDYSETRYAASADFLKSVRLELADGSSVTVCDLASCMPCRDWYPDCRPDYEATTDYYDIYYLADVLDISTVTGITIDGVTYPLG